MQETAIVEVGMNFETDENISQARITKFSGYTSLVDAALYATKEARSVEMRPEGMKAWQTVVVKFHL